MSDFKKKLDELEKDLSLEEVSKRGGFTTLDLSKCKCLLGEVLSEIDRLESDIVIKDNAIKHIAIQYNLMVGERDRLEQEKKTLTHQIGTQQKQLDYFGEELVKRDTRIKELEQALT